MSSLNLFSLWIYCWSLYLSITFIFYCSFSKSSCELLLFFNVLSFIIFLFYNFMISSIYPDFSGGSSISENFNFFRLSIILRFLMYWRASLFTSYSSTTFYLISNESATIFESSYEEILLILDLSSI